MRLTDLLSWAEAWAKAGSARSKDADRVRRIGRRLLASVTSPGISSRVGWPRRIVLVEGRTPNAYCWSDGTITVNTALIDGLKPSDDELAFLIGHEMAHAIRRHVRQQASRNVLLLRGDAYRMAVWEPRRRLG
jgi:Zn-dependent protease with chaperone function